MIQLRFSGLLSNSIYNIFIPGNKDCYRGCDYRLSVAIVYIRLKGKCPKEIEV